MSKAANESISIPIESLMDAGIIHREKRDEIYNPLESIKRGLQTVNWEKANAIECIDINTANYCYNLPVETTTAQKYLNPAPELPECLEKAFAIIKEKSDAQQYDNDGTIVIGEKEISFTPPVEIIRKSQQRAPASGDCCTTQPNKRANRLR